MKAKDVTKPLRHGQAGGIASREKNGLGFYSKIAKKMHADRKKLIEILKK